MSRRPLRVGIVGCGLIGRKRAEALRPQDELVGCSDVVPDAAERLARRLRRAGLRRPGRAARARAPRGGRRDVARSACAAGRAGARRRCARARREAGRRSARRRSTQLEPRWPSARRVSSRSGFNHRFHPGIARAAAEVHSGRHGELMHLTGRYGHGGRPGYEREWRAQPERSGGGELIDQGMHLLDLVHWLAGPLPAALGAAAHTVLGHAGGGQRGADTRRRPTTAPRPGRCCTSAGPSGRTRSRSRSTAGPPSSRSTGSCARTARSACASTA